MLFTSKTVENSPLIDTGRKGIEEIKDLLDEQEAIARQTASLTTEKGSVRRRHSRIKLIGLIP